MFNTKFKVNRMFLSGKGKKIYEQGDIITADQVENFVDLVANRSLVPCDENDETETAESETETESKEVEAETETENEGQPIYTFLGKNGKEVKVFTIKEATVASMRVELISRSVVFDPTADKNELFELLTKK